MQYHGTGFKTIIRETRFLSDILGEGGCYTTRVCGKGFNVLEKWQTYDINTLFMETWGKVGMAR